MGKRITHPRITLYERDRLPLQVTKDVNLEIASGKYRLCLLVIVILPYAYE